MLQMNEINNNMQSVLMLVAFFPLDIDRKSKFPEIMYCLKYI